MMKMKFLQTLRAKSYNKDRALLIITIPCQALLLSSVSLILSITLSSPLFFKTKLEMKHTLFTNATLSYCYEDWGPDHGRLLYTSACIILQYLLPSVTVGIAYTRYADIVGIAYTRYVDIVEITYTRYVVIVGIAYTRYANIVGISYTRYAVIVGIAYTRYADIV